MSTSSSTASVASSTSEPVQHQPSNNLTTNAVCEVERLLVEQSNRWTTLCALCIGLEETLDDGSKRPLLDFNEPIFKSLKKKDIKPSLDCLREEIKRRSGRDPNKTNIPKPNGWNAPKCLNWLKANPITNDDDVTFLQKKAKEVKQVAANASQRTPESLENLPSDEIGNKWFGPLPYLRLIHCLLEDDIKRQWIHRNDPKSIQEIDARRSDVRPETVFEMIANRWNSNSFNPTTMVTSCHVDFSIEIDIGFEATADFARASPTKVKDKIAKMKSDLTSIIEKWERSGQGEGGRLDDVEELEEDDGYVPGSLDDMLQETANGVSFEWGRSAGRRGAFDCRESFLGTHPPYLLYFWDVLDDTDLFNTTINRLSDEAGASSANEVPSIVTTNGKSSNSTRNDDVSVFVSSFRDVIIEASKDASIAADRRHAENQQDKERRHKEAIEAEDKRAAMKTNAADNRVILQARLDNKSYLKRRIDDLQDEARKF